MPAELFCETHAAGHVIGSARPNQSLGFNRGSEKENWIRTFPWFTLLASWAASFGLQHRWDASLLWVDGGGPVSDLAQAAAYGDVQRQVLTVLLGTLGVWLLLRAKGRGLRRAGGAPGCSSPTTVGQQSATFGLTIRRSCCDGDLPGDDRIALLPGRAWPCRSL
jgi:hypothetical protein